MRLLTETLALRVPLEVKKKIEELAIAKNQIFY